MRAITSAEAKEDLDRLIAQVIADAEPAVVITDAGQQVVVLPIDEFNSWQETRYLLVNPSNAEHLRKSIAEAQAGTVEERELVEP
ncbi:MAG: type II toxin-antitoxin system Phd/YefM family antitoxin [Dehalococcoidia bacterium]